MVIVNETTNIICGCCPHPRAPGALALSLDRERDLEMDTETEPKKSQTRRMTAYSIKLFTRHHTKAREEFRVTCR